MPLHVSSTCAHIQEVKIASHRFWYHQTYRWPSRARDKGKQNHQSDHEVEPKDWTHAADSVKINEQTEGNEHTIQIFTDGSKNEHGVGSGTAIYIHRTN